MNHCRLDFNYLLSRCKWQLLSSADNICKHFGPGSGPTKCWSWSWSKPFDTLIVFLKLKKKHGALQWHISGGGMYMMWQCVHWMQPHVLCSALLNCHFGTNLSPTYSMNCIKCQTFFEWVLLACIAQNVKLLLNEKLIYKYYIVLVLSVLFTVMYIL